MGPGVLSKVLADLPIFYNENILIGQDALDDAGVYKLTPDMALIQTLDFLTPMVDTPYLFGQIAAANSLSDVYAMGGRPLTALNITAFPSCSMDIGILRDILAGGADKIKEAEAVLLGGHTVEDKEPKYGLSVTGVVHPDRIISNGSAKPGDLLILTKPLGTGIITTALKGEFVTEKEIVEVINTMAFLNKSACKAMIAAGVTTATDITGFGFLGHLSEVCAASGVSAEISMGALPIWSEAYTYASLGLVPGGAYANRKYLIETIRFAKDIQENAQDILFDPQTSGGLLIAVNPQKLKILQNELATQGIINQVVGTIIPKEEWSITVGKA